MNVPLDGAEVLAVATAIGTGIGTVLVRGLRQDLNELLRHSHDHLGNTGAIGQQSAGPPVIPGSPMAPPPPNAPVVEQ